MAESPIKPNDDDKKHPVAKESEKDLNLKGKAISKFIEGIDSEIETDVNAVSSHQNRLSHWYQRRYGLLDKDPQYPWPGSANINMPLIDAEVSKSKAPIMQLVETNPIVSFKATNASSFEQTDAAENTMQHLLTTRMRGFKDSIEMIADNMGMYGYAFAKVCYEYHTSVKKEQIRRAELSIEDKQTIAQLIAFAENGVGPDGQPFTQEDLDINLTDFVSERWGLDVDDPVDQIAIDKIIKWVTDLNEKQETVSIKRTFIEHDAPHVSLVDPSKIFFEEGVKNVQDAERITEMYEDTVNDMKKKAKTGWYDATAVANILHELQRKSDDQPGSVSGKNEEDSKVTASQLNAARKDREGMSSSSRRGIIPMKEVYCLYDIDGDGVDERCLLIYNSDTRIPVRFMEYPYEHGQWPYVGFYNEITDGRLLSSRGLGEILNDIDNVITQNHRNKLNAMQISNSKTFKYRLGSNFNPGQMRWIPGQFVPVMNMNDFEEIAVSSNDFSFDNEELNLKFWGENLVGSFDTAFRQQKSEARSAREVAAIQGIQQASQSLRISRFQRAAKLMYEQIWGLWMQYGPEKYTLTLSSGELRHYTKHEINGRFDLVPVGTVGNTNPEVEAIRARETVDFLMLLAQSGLLEVATQQFNVDIGAAVKDVLDKVDFVTSQRIMQRKPIEQLQAEAEAAAQQQAQAEQQQAVQNNQPLPLADLQAQLKQMQKQAPNGGAQQVAI